MPQVANTHADITRAILAQLAERGLDPTAYDVRTLAAEAARTHCVAHREGWTVLTSAGRVSRERDPMGSLANQLAARLEHVRRAASARETPHPAQHDQQQRIADCYGASVIRESA